MNTKHFPEYLSYNFIPKIVCVVLAALIVFFHNFNTMEKKVLEVPLKVESRGNMTAKTSTGVTKKVKVTLRGPRDKLANISVNDIKASVDISAQTKEGRFSFPVYIDPSDNLMLVSPLEIICKPEAVELTVEENIVRYLPLDVVVAGVPAYGYEQTGLSYEPTTVKVSGPRSIVSSLEQIQTELVNIDGFEKSRSVRTFATRTNQLVDVDTTTPVEVSVTMAAIGGSKILKGVRVGYDNLGDMLEVTSSQSSVDVVLSGTLLAIEKLRDSSIVASVDCSSLSASGTYRLPVSVFVPAGIQVASQSIDLMSVTVVEKVVEEEPPLEELVE